MSRREEKNNDGTKQKQCTAVGRRRRRRRRLLLKGAFDNNAKSSAFLSHGSVVGESHGASRRIVCRCPDPRPSPLTAIARRKLKCPDRTASAAAAPETDTREPVTGCRSSHSHAETTGQQLQLRQIHGARAVDASSSAATPVRRRDVPSHHPTRPTRGGRASAAHGGRR